MILDLLPTLTPLRIVLASASPRRIELLSKLGLSPIIRPSQFDETLAKHDVTVLEYVRATARAKALDVRHSLSLESFPFDVIISSDTVVEAEGSILEKPVDADHARRMMQALSGRTHRVLTAVCIIVKTAVPSCGARALGGPSTLVVEQLGAERGSLVTFVETAEVTFASLPPSLIDAYVRTPEPFDKAGGYGIQGMAAQFVSGINGDYYCVMGFPLHTFCAVMRALVELGLVGKSDVP